MRSAAAARMSAGRRSCPKSCSAKKRCWDWASPARRRSYIRRRRSNPGPRARTSSSTSRCPRARKAASGSLQWLSTRGLEQPMGMHAMQALELDFSGNRRRSPWVGRALLAAALLFGAQVTASYVDLRGKVDAGEARLARHSGEQGSSAGRNVSEDELREARETVQRLALPWANLF